MPRTNLLNRAYNFQTNNLHVLIVLTSISMEFNTRIITVYTCGPRTGYQLQQTNPKSVNR